MKYTLLLLLMLPAAAFAQVNRSLAYNAPAQSSYYPVAAVSPVVQGLRAKGDYRVAMPPGYRTRNTGRVLTGIGGALLLTGVICLATADEQYYEYSNVNGQIEETGDPKFVIGVLGIIGGVGMTIPGVILWTKGGRRYSRYLEQQQQENRPAARIQMNNRGLTLTYHF